MEFLFSHCTRFLLQIQPGCIARLYKIDHTDVYMWVQTVPRLQRYPPSGLLFFPLSIETQISFRFLFATVLASLFPCCAARFVLGPRRGGNALVNVALCVSFLFITEPNCIATSTLFFLSTPNNNNGKSKNGKEELKD